MSTEKFFTHPVGIFISATGAAFLWGSAFPAIKVSYERLQIKSSEIGEQMLFAGYRFFLAGVLVWLFFFFLRQNMRIKKVDLGTLVKVGFFQTFLQYCFFYVGVNLSTGIQGSIIAGMGTFFQLILAHFIYANDKMTRRKVQGLAIGFGGVIIANMTKGSIGVSFGLGDGLLVIAMIASAYGNILAKNASAKLRVGYVTSYQMMMGGAALLLLGMPFAGVFPFTFDLLTVLLFIYLALISAVGFILWNNVMKYNTVGRVSMYLFLVPVFGVILSAIVLNEPLHGQIMIALVMVAAGIILVNRSGEKGIQAV